MERVTNPLAQNLADRFTTLAHMLRKTLGAPDYARIDLTLNDTDVAPIPRTRKVAHASRV
ncbi:hypothetical protein ACOSOMT5_P2469 [Acidiphilium sp. MT5]|jgi:hypothetical protein